MNNPELSVKPSTTGGFVIVSSSGANIGGAIYDTEEQAKTALDELNKKSKALEDSVRQGTDKNLKQYSQQAHQQTQEEQIKTTPKTSQQK